MRPNKEHEAVVVGLKQVLVGVMIFDALLMLYIGIAVSYLWVMSEWYGSNPIEDVLNPPRLLFEYFSTIIGGYVQPYFETLDARFLAIVFLPPLIGAIIAVTSAITLWRVIVLRTENHLPKAGSEESSSLQRSTDRTDTTAF